MIDTHCHLLPGIDDSAADDCEALSMARRAEADNISVAIVTPHVNSAAKLLSPVESIAFEIQRLQRLVVAEGLRLRLIPGAEVAMTAVPYFECGQLRSLSIGSEGRYLIVELASSELPCGFSQAIFSIQQQGFSPILAHPERIAAVAADPGVLEGDVHRGLLLQVTAGSLTGFFGGAAHSAALALIRQGWVQLLATDAHDSTERCMVLSPAVEKLKRWLVSSEIHALVHRNGERLLRGEVLPHGTRAYQPFRRFWFFGN